ncbi:MAG: hypothetical protein CSA95_07510 [Bacteroidetes bacterium]|nr:MAG: hypothetical protein CSA95_07510 [Bacteroidota bacterium]
MNGRYLSPLKQAFNHISSFLFALEIGALPDPLGMALLNPKYPIHRAVFTGFHPKYPLIYVKSRPQSSLFPFFFLLS